jgi:hypothetical protein
MELFDVDISLDRINARITWIVSAERLDALRSAVNRGDFGRAHILSVEPRPTTVRTDLLAAIAA